LLSGAESLAKILNNFIRVILKARPDQGKNVFANTLAYQNISKFTTKFILDWLRVK
jgi:hypothetical protein